MKTDISNKYPIVGVVQCRMGSRRLPGKAMYDLNGKTVLEWTLQRVLRAKLLTKVVLATTTKSVDDCLIKTADKLGIPSIRGSEDNVLKRYMKVLECYPAKTVVRITADNPLTEPLAIDAVVTQQSKTGDDYCYMAQIPYGMAADAFSARKLSNVASVAEEGRHLEHINTYFLDNYLRFKISHATPPSQWKRSDVYMTLDTKSDYLRLKAIFKALDVPLTASMDDIINSYDELPVHLKKSV